MVSVYSWWCCVWLLNALLFPDLHRRGIRKWWPVSVHLSVGCLNWTVCHKQIGIYYVLSREIEIVLAESYSILFASQVIFMALYIVFLLTHLLHTLVYRNGCSLFIVPGDLSAVRVTTRTFRRLFQFFRTLYSTSSYDKFSLFLACCICCVLLKLYFNNDMYVIIKIDPNSLYSIFWAICHRRREMPYVVLSDSEFLQS